MVSFSGDPYPMKNFHPPSVISLGLALGLWATHAQAGTQYFDVNGANAGYGTVNGATYSWEDPNWANAAGGANGTGAWESGSFARFSGGVSGDLYAVTLNQSESMAGLYNTVAGTTVMITDGGSGNGALNVVSGDQGFLATGSVGITVPITGSGGVAPQMSGALGLFGQNTYSGGTTFGYYRYPFTYFNNSSSFGTGPLRFFNGVGGFQPLLAIGGAKITLPNDFQIQSSGQGINFASDVNTPVVSTGNWSLGENNLSLRNNGDSTAPLTLAGVISGTADISLSANFKGTIIFSGANTYSGATIVGKGASPVTLKLGAANTLASSSTLVLAGGVVDPGGLHHQMGATTLNLTDNSIIDFSGGAAEIDFANSSGWIWTAGKILNLVNWDASQDALRFGLNAHGLTAAQLAAIEFNGSGLGTAQLDANGFLVVPEPSTVALGLCGALSLWLARRRKI